MLLLLLCAIQLHLAQKSVLEMHLRLHYPGGIVKGCDLFCVLISHGGILQPQEHIPATSLHVVEFDHHFYSSVTIRAFPLFI